MRTTIGKYAIGAALSGALALCAAASSGHVQAGVDVANRVAQFCVPAHDDDIDAHRFYCVKSDDGKTQL